MEEKSKFSVFSELSFPTVVSQLITMSDLEWKIPNWDVTGWSKKLILPLMKWSDSIFLLNAVENILLPFFLFFRKKKTPKSLKQFTS